MKKGSEHSGDKSSSGNRGLIYGLLLSSLLHLPLVLPELGKTVTAADIIHVARVNLERLLKWPFKFKERSRLAEKIRNYLDGKEGLDFGSAILEMEFVEGDIDAEELEEGNNELNRLTDFFQKMAKKTKPLKLLGGLGKSAGEYHGVNALLSGILIGEDNNRGGNCSAFAKFSASILRRVYPTMPIQFQDVRLDGAMHIRTLAQIEGQWYAVERSGPQPLSAQDLQGTVLHTPDDFTKRSIGVGGQGTFVPNDRQTSAPPTPTQLSPTDESWGFFGADDGIDPDRIKNLTSQGSAFANRPGSLPLGALSNEPKQGGGANSPVHFSSSGDTVQLRLLNKDEMRSALERQQRIVNEKRIRLLGELNEIHSRTKGIRLAPPDREADVRHQLDALAPGWSDALKQELTPILADFAFSWNVARIGSDGELTGGSRSQLYESACKKLESLINRHFGPEYPDGSGPEFRPGKRSRWTKMSPQDIANFEAICDFFTIE